MLISSKIGFGEDRMDRRNFIKSVGLAGAGMAAVAAPAVAQAQPEIRWRLAQSFPKTIDTLYGGSESLAKYVSVATDGKFNIRTFGPGDIVGPFQVLDAVSSGTVEAGFTACYYYWGKEPAFALATAVPFGLNARQQNAWLYHGGGNDLVNAIFAKFNVVGFPVANTGAQMGGWFRKEINSAADLNGLKMRIGGFGGGILQKLGVVPQQIPAGEIYPALERGTIDAVEFVGPYDDERLNLFKVAPYYYYPGFWEGGAILHLVVNKAKWDALPETYKAIIRTSAQAVNMDVLAKYDHVNPIALKSLIAKGAKLRVYPNDILEASFEASKKTYAELSAANADFKKIHDSMMAFRKDAYGWQQVAEAGFDNYMTQLHKADKL